VCRSHHRQFNRGYYVLVPSKRQRDTLLNHERIDFAHRESHIASGQPDPGRTLPHVSTCKNALNFNLLNRHLKIIDEVEHIPIHGRRFRAYIHNPTCYDETMFVFDTVGHYPCPLLHFHASPICLMVQAQPYLASAVEAAYLTLQRSAP
jgi:hypothetical protein